MISEIFRPEPDGRVVLVAREQAGLPIHTADAQIAAICRANGATCATRNSKDFNLTGGDLVHPWTA